MTRPHATPSPSGKITALGKYSSLLHPSPLEEQEQEQERSVPAKTCPGRDMEAEMEESGWQTCYSVHHSLNITIHCIPYSVHCTLYTVHCKLYTVHFTLYTIHCTQYKKENFKNKDIDSMEESDDEYIPSSDDENILVTPPSRENSMGTREAPRLKAKTHTRCN